MSGCHSSRLSGFANAGRRRPAGDLAKVLILTSLLVSLLLNSFFSEMEKNGMNKITLTIFVSMLVAGSLLIGCADQTASQQDNAEPQVDASQFVLTRAPENAQSVLALRESAQDEDEIVIRGRIGGSSNPFVDGAAAFTIVDVTLPYCGEGEEECGCPTPWDYCCETSEDIAGHSATIKFVDENDRPRRFDPKSMLNIQELSMVVVQGKVKRNAGNLTVLAEKIFVQQ